MGFAADKIVDPYGSIDKADDERYRAYAAVMMAGVGLAERKTEEKVEEKPVEKQPVVSAVSRTRKTVDNYAEFQAKRNKLNNWRK